VSVAIAQVDIVDWHGSS